MMQAAWLTRWRLIVILAVIGVLLVFWSLWDYLWVTLIHSGTVESQ